MNRPYCGTKDNPPQGRPRGTSTQCFILGRRAGYIGGISKGLVKLTRGELNKLFKDVVRVIAMKFNITGYSRMSKDELITNILRVKGQRRTFNLDDLR